MTEKHKDIFYKHNISKTNGIITNALQNESIIDVLENIIIMDA